MSRSYKKPWVKDPANSHMKKLHARAYRSRCKQILTTFKVAWNDDLSYYEELGYDEFGRLTLLTPELKDRGNEPTFPHKREIINQCTICDYIFYAPDCFHEKNGKFIK